MKFEMKLLQFFELRGTSFQWNARKLLCPHRLFIVPSMFLAMLLTVTPEYLQCSGSNLTILPVEIPKFPALIEIQSRKTSTFLEFAGNRGESSDFGSEIFADFREMFAAWMRCVHVGGGVRWYA